MFQDGSSFTVVVGCVVVAVLPAMVGAPSPRLGSRERLGNIDTVGRSVGMRVVVGDAEDMKLGRAEGSGVLGAELGLADGCREGLLLVSGCTRSSDGKLLGINEGAILGTTEGRWLGDNRSGSLKNLVMPMVWNCV